MPEELAVLFDLEELLVSNVYPLLRDHGYRTWESFASKKNDANDCALLHFTCEPMTAVDHALFVTGGAFVRKPPQPGMSEELQREIDERVPSVGQSQFYFHVMPPTAVGWNAIPGGDQRWRVAAGARQALATDELRRVLRDSILPLLDALLGGERQVDLASHEVVRVKRQAAPFI